jgi:uncharacterized protein (TIGR03437 family)
MCRVKSIIASSLALASLVSLPRGLLGQNVKPTIAAVVNAASYASGPVSPGEMVVIFGSAMGPASLATLQFDEKGRITTTVSGVRVLFNGTAAPLIYASATQIAAMAPYGLAEAEGTTIRVIYGGVASDAFQAPVIPTAPGIFSADASGKGQAAIANSDGSLNSSTNPAVPGSFVTFCLTGEGQTDPPGSDGNLATATASVGLPVTVRIAGRQAQVLYAGSAPGNVNGFAQINVIIPADLQYGGNLPLMVKIGNASSQPELNIAVAGPPAPMPAAPQNLAVSSSSSQIALTWTRPDTLATTFHVERRAGANEAFVEIATVPATSATYIDAAAVAGREYQYRIRAENNYGFSAYSAVVSATAPAQLMPPSNPQAIAVGQTQINLTWSAATTNASRLHIERKTGAAGIYAEITTVPGTAVSYQDTAVQANTTYTYRMRSEGSSGLSAYSNETSATTPALTLPSPPTLQGTATSFSQVHLAWTTTTTGIIRFRLERRTATGVYSEISQPNTTSTSFDDSDLTASTTYLYRIRLETGAGLSPYSNEVAVTTLQGLPSAPTSFQAIAISPVQVNLAWTNNAPNATAIRVEYLTTGSALYTDIGAAATLTSNEITNLQPNTHYSFRVRAQNSAGYSSYSNVATATTLPMPKTVFLIHGLNQSPVDMNNLAANLNNRSYGLNQTRFQPVDAGFDFSDCADWTLLPCSSGCTISSGAQRLAQYVVRANPPGDIVLIGFSLGGLIARDLIVNNRIILNGRKIHLVTIGTPNLGYPYLATDSAVFCSAIVSAMYGDWRAQPGTVVLSDYLLSLTSQWNAYGFPGIGRTWLAASGRACNIPTRLGEGCLDQNPYSDGVVCQDSAGYNVSTSAGTQPNRSWADPYGAYVHSFSWTTGLILCPTTDRTKYLPLYDPPPTPGGLFTALTAILNGL